MKSSVTVSKSAWYLPHHATYAPIVSEARRRAKSNASLKRKRFLAPVGGVGRAVVVMDEMVPAGIMKGIEFLEVVDGGLTLCELGGIGAVVWGKEWRCWWGKRALCGLSACDDEVVCIYYGCRAALRCGIIMFRGVSCMKQFAFAPEAVGTNRYISTASRAPPQIRLLFLFVILPGIPIFWKQLWLFISFQW